MNPHSGDEDGGPSTPIQEQALAWFARLRDSRVAGADRAAFDRWLKADPRHGEAYAKVLALWGAPAFESALSRYADLAAPVPVQCRHPRRWAAAAALVLMVGGGGLLAGGGWMERWQADVATVTGEQRSIVLADGSTVTLNTDTALVLEFGEQRRGVRLLAGEAYFEVQPDSARPFVVRTDEASVRVVGTRFSVSEGEGTAVAVESGIVACANERGESVQLTRGQQVRVSNARVTVPEPVDAGLAFAWLKGRLVFKDQPLGRVLAEVDRYHPGAIFVASGERAQISVTGNYKLGDTAAIVRSLADATGGRVVTVSKYLTIVR